MKKADLVRIIENAVEVAYEGTAKSGSSVPVIVGSIATGLVTTVVGTSVNRKALEKILLQKVSDKTKPTTK